MTNNEVWIETYTGVRFNLLNPTTQEINITDIAHALALICRFTGHITHFYSVAEHAVRVASLVPEDQKLLALLHDSAEAYLNDLSRPVKFLLPEYSKMETHILSVITKTFDIINPDWEIIRDADNIVGTLEVLSLMPNKGQGWDESSGFGIHPETLSKLPKIVPLTWQEAEAKFLVMFYKYKMED